MAKFRSFFTSLALLALCGSTAWAQRRVTGRVTAQGSGEPLSAASVQIVGTTTGVYTGEDGTFAVTVPDGSQQLRVRRIGYRQQVVAVPGTQTEVTVQLERDVLQLETQVVTGTATSVARQNAPNAVAVVTSEEIVRAPAPTIDNALQGKIAGATISTNSGAPGGGTQIQLRGVTSINASSSPLYVVDGVIVSNQAIGSGLNSISNAGARTSISTDQDQQVNRIADLNPNDIESVEVLKGPSAGSIYGSKASNGVIVITTKRGQNGRPQVSFTQRVGTYQLANKLDLRRFSTIGEVYDYLGAETAADSAALLEEYGATPQFNDFEEQFYRADKPSFESLLSVRGGTGGTSYYVSGLAKRDNAIQRGSYYRKESLTANLNQTLGSRFTLRSTNNIIHTLTDRGISGNDNSPVTSPGDIFSNTPTFVNLRDKVDGEYQPNPILAEGTNPFQTADIVKNPEDVYRYIGSLNLTFAALASARQTLDFTLLGGLDTYQYNSRLTSPPEAFYEPFDGLPGTIVTNKSSSQYANLNLSGVHRFNAAPFTATTSFGLRREYRASDIILNQGRNTPPGVENVDLAVQQSIDETQNRVKDLAYYAQEEFLTLNERLLLTAAINAERSSVNGDADKFYAFPKFAASYRFPFLPRGTDEIKFRAAYGKAGNQPPFGYAYTSLVTGVYGGGIGARPSLIFGASDIKPETSTEVEGGVDVQFLRGRVGLEATVFRTDITDLILEAAVAPSSGFTTRYINGGEMYKTGLELGLNAQPIQTRGFNWTSRTTFSNYNSKVTRLDVPCFNGGSYFSVRYGAPWVCDGSDSSSSDGYSITAVQVVDECSVALVQGACPAAGRVNKVYESAPDFQMGFSNNFEILNGFRIGTLLDWRAGGKAVNITNNYFDGTNLLADTAAVRIRNEQFAAGRGVYLEDAGFVKLREINLSYTLPRSFINGALGGFARDVTLELAGRNLYTWTDYTGYDPEVSNFSSENIGRFQDLTPYPPSRSFFFSISTNF